MGSNSALDATWALGKYLTRSCLWRFGVKLRQSSRAVSGALLSIVADMKRRYRNGLKRAIQSAPDHGRLQSTSQRSN